LSGYNNYGYGLKSDMTGWFRKNTIAPEAVQQRYKNRKVLYMVGRDDDDTKGRLSYEIFAVLLQGKNRLERAQIHYGHLLNLFGDEIKKTLYRAIVPKSGH
jgi:hypothetical protein